jgi:transposase-like protein
VRVRRIDGERVAYREITVIEIKEVLRLWLHNKMGLRPIAEMVGVDRKTVRRYIDAAVAAGPGPRRR